MGFAAATKGDLIMANHGDQDLSTILARVGRLEDEQAIRDTLHRYGHAIDHGDEAGWVDLFEPDGSIEMTNSQTGESVRPTVGHDRLRRLVQRHTRAPHQWHQHIVGNTLIAVTDDTAQAESYFFLLLSRDGTPDVAAFGRYHDHLVRNPDGRWRFRRRFIELDSASEFSVFQ